MGAQRSTWKEDEGSKAHTKEMKARMRTRMKMRARRRTQKDGWGLEGALERMVEGSKAHLKEVRAPRGTQNDGRGLEGALKEGEGGKAH
jgi:hypothetical protein